MVYRIGRHKLTKQVRENICKYVGHGWSLEAAAEGEGLSYRVFQQWQSRGKQALSVALARWDDAHPESDPTEAQLAALIAPSEMPYVELATDVQRAYARAEGGYTDSVYRMAKRDWRAAAWWLERRRPQHYGNRETLRVEYDPTTKSNEELVAELNELGFVQATVVDVSTSAAADAGTGDNHNALSSGAGAVVHAHATDADATDADATDADATDADATDADATDAHATDAHADADDTSATEGGDDGERQAG